jgi:superfamily I DNA and RNA helicase
MPLEINANNVLLNEHPSAKSLISILEKNDEKLGISDAILYYDLQFAIDFDGTPQRFDIIISSKKYGIIIFYCMDISKRTLKAEHITELVTEYQQNYSALFSKLLKNSNLRKGPTELKINAHPLFYFFSQDDLKKDDFNSFINEWEDLKVVLNLKDITTYFKSIKQTEPFTDLIYNEIRAMLEGSKGILHTSSRPKKNLDAKSKGRILDRIQSEITLFDADQKRAALQIIDGPQRIRGLAGSGKTIVLTMKVAQIHASSPDARILYTYWTKQLHGYIKRLITRFYRQLSDKDPNWDKIDIIHAWGGKNLRGVYYDACKMNGIQPKTLGDLMKYKNKAFKVACQDLEKYKLTGVLRFVMYQYFSS